MTKEARMAWTSKKEEFMQRKVEKVEFRRGELMEDFRERQARACLSDEKYWKHICCACGEATHDMKDECGECISPQAAAHADAFVRTAFQVAVDETITSENNTELCLKVTKHTLQVLEQLQEAASDCGTRRQCTAMTHLYPGVVWSEKQVKRHKCEVENANFFATELGVAKGRFTYENPESVEVYEGTVYGTSYQTDGVDDLTYGVGTTQQKVQVSLQLVNEGALNTLMEGDDELTMVKDWERCQVELGPSGTMSPRAVERESCGSQAHK